MYHYSIERIYIIEKFSKVTQKQPKPLCTINLINMFTHHINCILSFITNKKELPITVQRIVEWVISDGVTLSWQTHKYEILERREISAVVINNLIQFYCVTKY